MKHRSKILTILLALLMLAMLLSLMLGMSMSAYADGVAYLDENGDQQTAPSANSVSSSTTTWSNGWYVVDGTVTIGSRMKTHQSALALIPHL